jgi:hypothetical protein
MMLMMQNFVSKPNSSCSTITAVVMMIGLRCFRRGVVIVQQQLLPLPQQAAFNSAFSGLAAGFAADTVMLKIPVPLLRNAVISSALM